MPIKNIVVLDPGMESRTGHSAAWNVLIGVRAAEQGININFFLRNKCPAEDAGLLGPNAHPFFIFSLYKPAMEEPALANMQAFLTHALYMHRDMIRLQESRPGLLTGPDTLLLGHTMDAAAMLGIGLWYVALPQNIRPHLALSVHFMWNMPTELTQRHYTLAAEPFKYCGGMARFFGHPEHIRSILEQSGCEARPLPLPLEFTDAYAPQVSLLPGFTPVFGIAGHGREDKGLALFPHAIKKYLEAGGKGSFLLHLTPPYDAPKALRELSDLALCYPERIRLVTEHVSGRDYLNLLRGMNVALMPFNPDVYHSCRTSQFFHEAVSLGMAVIASAGGYLERELQALNNGSIIIPKQDAEELGAAMLELDASLPWRLEKARQAAAAHRSFHNMENLWNTLIER